MNIHPNIRIGFKTITNGDHKMGDEVMIFSVIFGSVVAIVFMGIANNIIKTWLKGRNHKSIAENEDFLKALKDFKEKTDRRLSNLEIIASGDDPSQIESMKDSIEFDNDQNGQKEALEKNNLKNMLNE